MRSLTLAHLCLLLKVFACTDPGLRRYYACTKFMRLISHPGIRGDTESLFDNHNKCSLLKYFCLIIARKPLAILKDHHAILSDWCFTDRLNSQWLLMTHDARYDCTCKHITHSKPYTKRWIPSFEYIELITVWRQSYQLL
ncbi:hypothetical protein WG66_012468 [Moniliophthora roreri]|nr:hypothetical protein WG66_012468 [Moniliophthora roreri]